MLYREYGKTHENVSILGFGCMRFPTNDGKIDEEKSTEMIEYALSKGVKYFDTAYTYHDGESESFVGKALEKYRKDIFIATKLPSWLIKSREDMDRILNEQLQRLRTDYIDFYLVHALNKDYFNSLKENGLFDFLNSIKLNGKVKHIGFSFHDSCDVFKEIVDSYPWEFCQIQYNYLDTNYQAGIEGLTYAADRRLGIAIMEPLRGGKLAGNIPDDIKELWDSSEVKKTPVEWALKYLWNDERINVVLSGMSDFAHIIDNINYAETSEINCLTNEELNLITKVTDAYNTKIKVNCTECRYCMPCPVGVNIPRNFDILNKASLFNDMEGYKNTYNSMDEESKAASCIKCGKCETLCPQNIQIREKLEEVIGTFDKR